MPSIQHRKPPTIDRPNRFLESLILIGLILGCFGCPSRQELPTAGKREPTSATSSPKTNDQQLQPDQLSKADGSKAQSKTSDREPAQMTSRGPEGSLATDSDSPLDGETRGQDSGSQVSKATSGANADAMKEYPSSEKLRRMADEGRITFRRYVIMHDAGPIIVDLSASLNDASLEKQLEQIQETVIPSIAGAPLDSFDWETILEEPKLTKNVFSNLRPSDNSSAKALIQQYDVDRNGKASAKELHAFLTRGTAIRSLLSLDEANRFRGKNVDESAIFRQLDTDHDDALSDDETSKVAQQLKRMDMNGDFVVSLSEVMPAETDARAYMRQRNPSFDDRVLVIVFGEEKKLVKTLLNQYSFADTLAVESWPSRPDLFQLLDADEDKTITRTELMKISDVPSDFYLELKWSQPTDKAPSVLRWTASIRSLGKTIAVDESPLVDFGYARFRLRSTDVLGQKELAMRTEQLAGSLAISRERGRKVETEIATEGNTLPALVALDEDKDGEVTYEEVEQAVELKAQLTTPVVRIRAIDPPDAWFVWIDQNWDGILSEREISEAGVRIKQRKGPEAHSISSIELPLHLELVVGRVFGDEQPFSSVSTEPESSPEVSQTPPEWFVSMDANSDGNLTIREFLGDRLIFTNLDKNGDRIISTSEAIANKDSSDTK